MNADTVYATDAIPGRFGRADVAKYLERIGLNPEMYLDQPPSFELLSELQSSHIFSIPFESTTLHVRDWSDETAEIHLGQGDSVGLAGAAFNRIVNLNRGGFCFSLNSSFAALLRYFGFRVSEVAARVFAHLGKDPSESGYDWQPTSHQCSIVDWIGSAGKRYFCDVGFGSSQSIEPIPFRDGAEHQGFPGHATFKIVRSECVPGIERHEYYCPDRIPYWTIYYRPIPSDGKGSFWSPTYTFTLASVAPIDFTVLNHYNSTHPKATFVNFFVCTKSVRETGERWTLFYKAGLEHKGQRCAKLQRTSADSSEADHIDWVEMKVGPMKVVLAKEFGFKFPSDYKGN